MSEIIMPPREKTLFFTGHRTINKRDADKLDALLDSAIGVFAARGFEYFITGGAVGFDTMAAEAVLRKKAEMPCLRLYLALPCRDQTVKWSKIADLSRYKKILGAADEVVYIHDFYTEGCMHERNRFMADSSSVCIAYLSHMNGGTAYTYRYAEKRGLTVVNLASAEEE